MEVQLHPFLTSSLDRFEWLAVCPANLHQGNLLSVVIEGDWLRPRNLSDLSEES